MTTAGIRYVELGARDLDRTGVFYRDLLGFEQVPAPADRGVPQAPSAWFSCGRTLLRVVDVGGSGTLGGWVDDDLQCGLRHVGFEVGDVDAWVSRLERAGTEVLVPPFDALGGVRAAFLRDPDGARLELVQGMRTYQHVDSPRRVAAEAARTLRDEDGPRFDHVALTVPDLPRTVEYWSREHGFEVMGSIRRHDDRGLVMTYLSAGRSVLEVLSFDVPTASPPQGIEGRLGLRGLGVAAVPAIDAVPVGRTDLDPSGTPVVRVDSRA